MFNPLHFVMKLMARKTLRKNRADLYYDIATSLEDRVPLFTTFRKYEARARRRKPGEALVYLDMLRGLSSGSMTKAFKNIAPSSELLMIDALQSAGDVKMAEGLKFLSQTAEKTDAMAAAAAKAVKYPLSMLVVFAAMLTGFSLHIVPILTTMLAPEKWPLLGRILYTISQLITNYGLYSFFFLVATALAFIYSLPRWHGRSRQIMDKFLPYRFYRDYSGAMLVVSLSMLLRSGVSLRSALDRSMTFSTPWMRFHIRRILKTLANANTPNFGEAFKTGVLNQYLEDRVQDASERRNPTEAFVRIGVGSIDRVIAEIHKSAASMSSAIMIVCGIVLFIMMGGFFSTTMELQSGIKASAQGSR
jgi:type II secretory pathway component PulF